MFGLKGTTKLFIEVCFLLVTSKTVLEKYNLIFIHQKLTKPQINRHINKYARYTHGNNQDNEQLVLWLNVKIDVNLNVENFGSVVSLCPSYFVIK